MNDNFEYLDGRITTVGSSVTTLQSNIQSLNTTLNNTINTAVSNINASLGHLPYSSYIDGLIITKSTTNTIAVTSGSCYDSGGDVVLKLTTSTTKQNESQASSTTYYVYIIGDNDGNTIDILISSSSSSPTMPTGYTKYRLIGSYTTNSDGNIDTISYYGESSTSDKSASAITNACMPDYANAITLPIGSPVPTNGYGFLCYGITNNNVFIYINNIFAFDGGGNDSNYLSVSFPLNKGDIVTISGGSYSTIINKFVPCKGIS